MTLPRSGDFANREVVTSDFDPYTKPNGTPDFELADPGAMADVADVADDDPLLLSIIHGSGLTPRQPTFVPGWTWQHPDRKRLWLHVKQNMVGKRLWHKEGMYRGRVGIFLWMTDYVWDDPRPDR